MKIKTHGMKLKISKSLGGVYPLGGILLAQLLLYLAPFVSLLLAYGAFAICLYRVLRYDARIFATDFAVLMPLSTLFRSPGGVSLLSYLCLIAAVRYVLSGGIRLNGAMALLLALANYLLLRMQMNISQFALYFGQMFLICIIMPKQDGQSAERSTKQFCMSLFISSVYALIFRNSAQIIAIRGNEVPAYWGSSFMRFQGIFGDPNYYMLQLILGLSLLIKLKDSEKISKKYFLSMGICMTIFGVLTYSKTFALAFVLLGCMYIFWQFRNRKYGLGSFLIAAIGLAVGVMMLLDISLFEVVLTRFTSASNLSDLTTGRTEIYQRYWNVISENSSRILFGLGLSAEGLDRDPHNLFLEVIYYTGIVGLLLVTWFYGCIGALVNKMTMSAVKQNFYAKYVVLLMAIIVFATLSGMFSVISGGVFFMAFLSILITKDLE